MRTLDAIIDGTNQVGIEVEYTDISLKHNRKIQTIINNAEFATTHDASVESPSNLLGGKPFSGGTFDKELDHAIIERAVIGGEIVTPILDTRDMGWLGNFDRIFSELKLAGERVKTSRGSIHVHVNYSGGAEIELRFLLVSWILAGYLESFFFRIGGMGREHRGEEMDFIYYRPITSNGPPVVRNQRGDMFPLLDYDGVLKSRTLEDFFFRCGDILNADSRYHPCRYLWVNYYNMVHDPQIHMEFRIFNKTLRCDYLYAVVELCKAFIKKALILSYKSFENGQTIDAMIKELSTQFPVMSVTQIPGNSQKHFWDVIQELDIKNPIKSILAIIWNKSSYTNFSNLLVFSHLFMRSSLFNGDRNGKPNKIIDKDIIAKIQQPNFIDIHKLEELGIRVFPEEK